MGCSAHTTLFMSPATLRRPDVQEILRDAWAPEFNDDNEPDDEGLVSVTALYHSLENDFGELTRLGMSFLAREDSTEDNGGRYLHVAHGGEYTTCSEDGCGTPVVRVLETGEVDTEELSTARRFWKLRNLVVTDRL